MYTLDDFQKEIRQVLQSSMFEILLSMVPRLRDDRHALVTYRQCWQRGEFSGVINSMTPDERRTPQIISADRRQRIAMEAGVEASTVDVVLELFEKLRPDLERFKRQNIERLKRR